MSSNKQPHSNNNQSGLVIHSAIQLLALSLLLAWCFLIIKPFITPLIWGAIIATALYPIHKKITVKLRGRSKLSAIFLATVFLLLIIGPIIGLLLATVDEVKVLMNFYNAGLLTVPPPNEVVKGWPVIGDSLYQYWVEASSNLTIFIAKHQDDLKPIALKLFDLLSSTTLGIIMLMVAIVISGAFLAYAEDANEFAESFFIKIAGNSGVEMTQTAAKSVRSVAKGVLGVAFIQSMLAGIGLGIAGIPFAGVWTFVSLILIVVQVGMLPVAIGVIIYIWSTGNTTTAILLTIWMVFVGTIDNILKPIFMGKGAPAPMLVVFIGSIGGFMASGFIGLFTGAIILSLSYKLLTAWLKKETIEID